jgi:hypothetical protein
LGRGVVGTSPVPRDDVRIRLDRGARGAEEVGRENEKRSVICGKQDLETRGRRFGLGDDFGGLSLGYALGK